MGNELLVAGVIDGLDPGQLLAQSRVVMFDIFHQFFLCQTGPANQHFARIRDSRRHVVW